MGPTQVQGACDGWGYDEANDWVDDDGREWNAACAGSSQWQDVNNRDEDKEKTSTDAKDAADAANEASQKASEDIMKLLHGSHVMASNQDIEKDSNEVDPSNEGVAAKGGFESLD